MNVCVFSIGTDNTLSIGNNDYEGVIGIEGLGITKEEKYQNQKEIFDKCYSLSRHKIRKCITVKSVDFFDISDKIIKSLDEIIKKYPKVVFDFEISGGYKIIGHALVLIAYLRYEHINDIFFIQFDRKIQRIPLMKVKLTKSEKGILNKISKINNPVKSLSQTKLMQEYYKQKTYIYRVIRKCKRIGLIDQNNKLTDFGKLYLKYV